MTHAKFTVNSNEIERSIPMKWFTDRQLYLEDWFVIGVFVAAVIVILAWR